MKRSFAILAVTAFCGGTVAVATAAYASDGDGTGAQESGGALSAWFDGVSDAVASDDPEGETFTCRLPNDAPARPDFGGLPAMPKISDLPELLYSEQAVRDRDSGEVSYQVTQLGEVTDSGDATLTVESADGTTWKWELTDETKVYANGRDSEVSSLEAGDRVLVDGTRDGDTRQAGHITNPAPQIGLGTEFGPPERMREALPDKLGELLPRLDDCEESQEREGTGTAA